MKYNKLFIAITVMLNAMACFAQPSNSNGMREKLKAFVESGEYQIQQPGKPNESVNLYHFAMQFAVDGGLGDSFSGPLLTPRLQELDRAFKTEAANANTIYIHDANEYASPLSGVQFRCQTASQQPMTYNVPFEQGKNIRLVSFEEDDGQVYALLLILENTINRDQYGDMVLTDGWIYEVSGRKLSNEPYIAHYTPQVSGSEAVDNSLETSADAFIEKVKRTCEIFKRESPQGKMAAGVVINKTCNAFNGKLTKEQYYDLLSNIQPLVDNEKNENLKQILAYSCYMIYMKSEAFH